ncbi:DUF1566 domain-containing protein [Leptospira koniambonensis]|uniref:DUF1566 domain-containing protein n=1 Tax=Leptospira koniambonensis TaxID=2484950 RepID=A0A4R9JDN3_9LEPT|nr:DUF1566 domain-containing protein [Leptospira koniambonensis]TGL36658.1 DUF1566 domain-containing protein [Leptospira koniambonensis]
MKHSVAVLLFSIVSLVNCSEDSKQDFTALLLTLGVSSHCGQRVANPVNFSGATDTTNVADESGLITALGGNNCETPSLTNNGNGTVTDSANRFMWTLCLIDGSSSPSKPHTYANPNCGALAGADASYNQAQAESICANLSFAGRTDWILPDAIQSNTLRSGSSPYALGVFGTADNSLPDAQLTWSSSYVTGTISNLAIFSRYANGEAFYSGNVNTNSQGLVFCVAKL